MIALAPQLRFDVGTELIAEATASIVVCSAQSFTALSVVLKTVCSELAISAVIWVSIVLTIQKTGDAELSKYCTSFGYDCDALCLGTCGKSDGEHSSPQVRHRMLEKPIRSNSVESVFSPSASR